MQYQVFKKDTGELKEGYCIKYGENLTVREESENDEAEK